MNLKLISKLSYYFAANCIPIKGYGRSCLYDLHRKKAILIENDMIEFISNIYNLEIGELNLLNKRVLEYIELLKSHDLLLLVPNEILECFSTYNSEFHSSLRLSNVILEFDNHSSFETLNLIQDIGGLFIQIRIIEELSKESLEMLISILSKSIFKYIEIVIPFKAFNLERTYLLQSITQVMCIFIIDAPKNSRKSFEKENLDKIFFSIQKSFNNYFQNYQLFVTNNSLFNESQQFNTYFNKKLFISSKGEIKNSPESEEVFGNFNVIKNKNSFYKILDDVSFQKYWHIKKDLIDVCNVCEFRHMCVDACIPVQRKNGTWYRKFECNYNPFICKWSDEEGYLNLSETDVTCNHEEFKLD